MCMQERQDHHRAPTSGCEVGRKRILEKKVTRGRGEVLCLDLGGPPMLVSWLFDIWQDRHFFIVPIEVLPAIVQECQYNLVV